MELSTSIIGEADAMVVRELYPVLRRFAAVVGSSDIEPDDLVHDVLVATLRARSLASLDNPVAYLRRGIVNAAASQRLRFVRQRRAYARWAGGRNEGESTAFPSDVAELLALPPRERAVLYLYAVEGLTLADVAHHLGISAAAARMAASRARRKLRYLLEEERNP